MFIDNYAFNQPITFEHKERMPYFIVILNILLLLGILITIAVYVGVLFFHASKYVFTNSQLNIFVIYSVIFWCFALFVAILIDYYKRFNFHYIVTFEKYSFTIGFSTRRSFKTLYFYRKISLDFNEKSKIVYMRDYMGHRYGFRYDENFRKFLEEIQII